MGPRGAVIGDPRRAQFAGPGEGPEQGLVRTLVPHPAVEAFDETVSRMGFPGAVQCPSILCSAHHVRIAFAVSLSPLSETVMPGLPRRSISAASSRATRRPEIDGPGMAVRPSRVMSATPFSIRNRRPQARLVMDEIQ